MSQDTDLATAVSAELASVDLVLAKLASASTVVNDPAVAQAITDLQASNAKMQSILNPTPAPATA